MGSELKSHTHTDSMRFQSVYSSPNEPRPKWRDSLKNFRYQNPPRRSCAASKDFPFSVVEEYLALGLLLHVTVPWAHCHQCCLMHSSWDPKIGQACKYRTIHGLQTFSSPQKRRPFLFNSTGVFTSWNLGNYWGPTTASLPLCVLQKDC